MERKISVLFSMVFLIFFSTSASATISTFYQGLTYPTGIAVHPNEHTLYVISGTSGSVWAIDINSNGSAGSLSLITESFSPNLDIDFDASGNLYGLGYGTDYIFRVTTTGVVDLCDVGSYDKGTAIAIEKPGLSTNKLYNSRENSLVLNWMYISDYNPNANANDQGYLSSCSTGFRFFHYRQSLNDIIATCEDKVVSVNPGSGACTDMITGMVQPNGIAVDTSGNVYVADTGTGQIKMKNILGVVKTIASGIDSPVGLAYDE
jgi:DNA-binding beta-propeller fold protein YncE